MTDPYHIHTGPAHGATVDNPETQGIAPFTASEVVEFRKSDKSAGAVIILLMTGIFLIGVFLYGAIAIITRSP
jgi:hypothetical protein